MDGVTILRTGYDWICYPNGLENLNGIEEQINKSSLRAPPNRFPFVVAAPF